MKNYSSREITTQANEEVNETNVHVKTSELPKKKEFEIFEKFSFRLMANRMKLENKSQFRSIVDSESDKGNDFKRNNEIFLLEDIGRVFT